MFPLTLDWTWNWTNSRSTGYWRRRTLTWRTVYHKKYAHGFVVLCFVVVMQSFIMNSHEVYIHINQCCFAGTGAIVRLPQCQWSKPDGYGKISQCITTTKHSKAKTVCIFLGIYCNCNERMPPWSHEKWTDVWSLEWMNERRVDHVVLHTIVIILHKVSMIISRVWKIALLLIYELHLIKHVRNSIASYVYKIYHWLIIW